MAPIIGSLSVVIIYAVIVLISFAISIATYVLTAIAYMKIGKKGGLKNGALAFFPFTSQYYAGKIAEKDCEINGKEVKPWGKTYLGLGIVSAVLGMVFSLLGLIFTVLGGSGAFTTFFDELSSLSVTSVTDFIAEIPDSLFTIFAIMVAIVLVEIVLAIILQVVGYIVLYKVYHLVAPESAGWLLVLSIFVSGASFVILLILGFGKKFRAHSVAVSDGTIVEE